MKDKEDKEDGQKVTLPVSGPDENKQVPRERVLRALKGEKITPTPVISVCQYATYQLMEKTGAFWPEAHRDGEKMAVLSQGGADILHLEAVRVPWCQTVEAEIYGAKIKDGGRTHIPSIDANPFKIGDPVKIPGHFTEKGRIPEILKAIRILKERVGDTAAVMGSIVGPFSVAASLVGIPQMLKATFRKPDSILPYIEAAEKTAEEYAAAMEEAGADVIVIEDMMASLDMISPKTYRNLVAPYEKQLITSIHIPVIVHICGKLDQVIGDIAGTGASGISVESTVDIPRAVALLKEKGMHIPIIGAVHPIEALLEGSPETVREQKEKSIREGVGMISPGCAVAPDSPLENLLAMTESVSS